MMMEQTLVLASSRRISGDDDESVRKLDRNQLSSAASTCSAGGSESPSEISDNPKTTTNTTSSADAENEQNPSIAINQTSSSASSKPQQIIDSLSIKLSAEEEENSQLKSPSDYESENDDDDEISDKKMNSKHSAESTTDDDNNNNSWLNDDNVPYSPKATTSPEIIELRFLVRRREAGALIGKGGANIKRLRDTFRSSMFSIPDTGNGPERVVCVATNEISVEPILNELTQLLVEKSPENDEQIELKLLIHSSQAGSLIGIGGQSIKKLRNDSRAAIKIYELCCPFSNERVCAIKARPPVVVNTIKLIQLNLKANPIKGTVKPYDALHFDLILADKYGGFLPDDGPEVAIQHYQSGRNIPPYASRQYHDIGVAYPQAEHYPFWRSPDLSAYNQHLLDMSEVVCHLDLHHHHHAAIQQSIAAAQLQQQQQSSPAIIQTNSSVSPPSPSASSSTKQQQHHHHFNKQQRQLTKHTNSTTSVDCDDLNKSCAFSSETRLLNHPHFAARYHPYASQAIGANSPYAPAAAAAIRPTSRNHHQHHHNHHHQQQQQQHFTSPFNSTYPPSSRLIYGAPSMHQLHHHHNHHRRDQFNNIRMPAVSLAGATGLQASAVRCRHAKPCFCMFMPLVPNMDLSAATPNSAQHQQQQQQQVAHLAKNFHQRNLATSSYNADNNKKS